MPEFLKLIPPNEALELFLRNLAPGKVKTETIETHLSLGRTISTSVVSSEYLPPFSRSAVDGYTLIASSTFGAGDSLPAYLKVIGEIPMGRQPGFSIKSGEAALIHTGGMLPDNADAVVMLEQTQPGSPGEIEIQKAVAKGENVIFKGEDIQPGQEVLSAGIRIRPAEIGGLLALGITEVEVARVPRIGVISSGDEVVPPSDRLVLGQVRDVNSYSLGAMITLQGGIPVPYGIAPDRADVLYSMAFKALSECDMIVVTAGSSASSRDLTSNVIRRLGQPGVLVHGINIKPGKPTILAVCDGKPVIGLPGNPVSALVISWLFLKPVIDLLTGLKHVNPRPSIPARLNVNVSSLAGREDWLPVKLIPTNDGWLADPIFFKSNLIFSLSRADGMIRIPAPATGLQKDDPIMVMLL